MSKFKKANFILPIRWMLYVCIFTVTFVSGWRFIYVDYFDPVVDKHASRKYYVINLDRSTDRLKAIKTQFERNHLKFERISAVDGKKITFDNNKGYDHLKKGGSYKVHCSQKKNEPADFIYSPSTYKRLMVPGEIGLLCSYRMLWTKIAESPEEQLALIFEDDVILSKDFSININNLVENFPNKWDVIYMDTREKHAILNGQWLKKSYAINEHLIKVTPFKGVWGTYAYILNRDSAAKLLQFQQANGNLQVDELFASLIKCKKIQVYVSIVEILTHNYAIDSTIGDRG